MLSLLPGRLCSAHTERWWGRVAVWCREAHVAVCWEGQWW